MDKKKINVALYTINLTNNGVFKIISTLSLALAEKYSVHIFVSDTHSKDFVPSFDLGGQIHFFNIPDPNNKNFFYKIYKNFLRKKQLRKHKIHNKIDVTITFSENPNIHNILTKGKDKVLISVHSFTSRNIVDIKKNKLFTFIYDKMIRKYFSRANKIIAVSKGIKNDLINNFSIKQNLIEVFYNPHDINRIKTMSEESLAIEYRSLLSDSFSIINIGRICVAKGHWNLIRAFSLVKKEIPNAKLIIMGDADSRLKDQIIKLIKNLKLQENVHLIDFQANPYNFLKNADIYVSSSIYEGLPNVLIETLACSIPIISTDCKSGPREILAPSTDFLRSTDTIEYAEYGILIPASKQGFLDATIPITSEEQLFAEAILKLYTDKEMERSYSEKGLNRAYDFGLDKIIKKYDKLIIKELNL